MDPNKGPTLKHVDEVALALKQVLGVRGLTYRELAEQSGIPLSTLKKILAGRGMQVTQLIKICGALEIEFADLENFSKRHYKKTKLSTEQEVLLTSDINAYLILIMLYRKYPLDVIREKLALDLTELNSILRALESVKLIYREIGGNAKVMVSQHLELDNLGPLQIAVERAALQKLLNHVYDKACEESSKFLSVCSLRMSKHSLQEMILEANELAEKAKSLSLRDCKLELRETIEVTFVTGIGAVDSALMSKSEIEAHLVLPNLH